MVRRDPGIDEKYTCDFTSAFSDPDIRVEPVGPRTPNLNAFVERWIQSLKHEALNHFVVFGPAHFDHIVCEFVDYYHERRPHQEVGNRLLAGKGKAPTITSTDQVRCESRLGGLLMSYRCAA